MESNYKKISKVLGIILIFNVIVSVTKIVVGLRTQSGSILADGFHSLSDGFNNIIGIVALFFAYRPADENHPYGHRKLEMVLSLGIGVILILLSYNLFNNTILNINDPVDINITLTSIILLAFTIIINIFVTIYELKKGKELNSSFLISDAKHTLSDVYISISVLISSIGIKYLGFSSNFDIILSFIVIIIILKTAFQVIKDAINILSDTRLIDPDQITKLIYTFSEVKDIHMIRSRGLEGYGFIDLHIMVDEDMTVKEAHKLNHDIIDLLRKNIFTELEIHIHIEPYSNTIS